MADEGTKKRVRKPVTVASLKEAVATWQKSVGVHLLAVGKLKEKLEGLPEGEAKAKLKERLAAEEAKLQSSQKKALSAQERLTALSQRTENRTRKERTHKLIVMGAEVEKAGLGDWPLEKLQKALAGLKAKDEAEAAAKRLSANLSKIQPNTGSQKQASQSTVSSASAFSFDAGKKA